MFRAESVPRALVTDAAACLAGQDRACYHVKEMVGALCERGLVVHPGKRRDQREQVGAVNVGPRYAGDVGTVEKPRADVVQRNA